MLDPVLLDTGIDQGLPAHYGDPFAEQRALYAGTAVVELANRPVFEISGPDRLNWLHSLTSQRFEGLTSGELTTGLILSPTGHIEQVLTGIDDGERFIGWTEPGRRDQLLEFLTGMVFMTRVTLNPRDDLRVWFHDGSWIISANCPVDYSRAGVWAYEAYRIASHQPRIFVDTDPNTIPNEIGLYGTALEKGCYRGQETVARVQNLGRPPRRLVALHLDGSVDQLPAPGARLLFQGKDVGFIGAAVRHHELGPIGLGLVRRNLPTEVELLADGIAVAQEVIVDPEVGLHFRPRLTER